MRHEAQDLIAVEEVLFDQLNYLLDHAETCRFKTGDVCADCSRLERIGLTLLSPFY